MVASILGILGFALGAVFTLLILQKQGRRWSEANNLLLEAKRKAGETATALAALEKADAEFKAKVGRVTQRIESEREQLEREQKEFRARHVAFEELQAENEMLKQDLQNIDVQIQKLRMDRDNQTQSQQQLDQRSIALAERYLGDVVKWAGASINANNYAACKQRIAKALEWCRQIGFEMEPARQEKIFSDLKAEYEMAVRAAIEREEQMRIKAKIREDQQREREIQRELQTLEREKTAIAAALERVLADTKHAHAEEIEQLRARLADAEARSQRAMSQAQMTKAGHIYVISNVGSFGENLFKIGMTRRLDPHDRVRELGDASVPFPFDVHMMISCDDAPCLESELHRHFHKHRVNKVNLRKEFFRVALAEIRQFVESRHGEVQYVADAEALEYRQSMYMSDEDRAVIEEAFAKAEQIVGAPDSED